MRLVLLVGLIQRGTPSGFPGPLRLPVGAERSTGTLKAGPGRTEAIIETGERGSESVNRAAHRAFGGLTALGREFLDLPAASASWSGTGGPR
jgi:hypothetical protein